MEILYQNEVEKQCISLAFIIRIYHDARSFECQIHQCPTSETNVSIYEGKSISKSQIMIEKKRMGIMTYKQHLLFNVISTQI